MLNRKKRLAQWDDPTTVWPPVTPRAVTKSKKEIVKVIEEEEYEKMKLLKNFEYPDFNVGDIVKFHYLHSLSEGRGNTYTGLIVGR